MNCPTPPSSIPSSSPPKRPVTTSSPPGTPPRPNSTQPRAELLLARRDKDRADERVRTAVPTRRTADTIQADLDTAEDAVTLLIGEQALARNEVKEAGVHADRVRRGQSDATTLLTDAGIYAAVLSDTIEIDPAHRDRWDPALVGWADAVIVGPDDLDRAAGVLTGQPGQVLISGPAGPLPDGIASAPAAAADFLTALADGTVRPDGTVTLASPPHLIIGGYDRPVIGRAARIAAAEEELAVYTELLDEATERLGAGETLVADLTAELDGAVARDAAETAQTNLTAAKGRHTRAVDAVEELRPDWDELTGAVTDAKAKRTGQAANLTAATETLGTLRTLWTPPSRAPRPT